jgi:hypothetical protein
MTTKKKSVHSAYILRSVFSAPIWTFDIQFYCSSTLIHRSSSSQAFILSWDWHFYLLLLSVRALFLAIVSNMFTHCDLLQMSGGQDFSRVPEAVDNRLTAITVTTIVQSFVMELQGGPAPVDRQAAA